MKYALLLLFILFSISSYSQGKTIEIKRAKFTNVDEEKYPGATILLGDVIMLHEGAELKCDWALHYKKRGIFKAIGNVRINQGDTIFQTSDYVDYDGNTKKILSWGNVVLKDPKMTLKTDTLQFNRAQKILIYDDYATIQDSINTLKSKNGNYYLNLKKFRATVNVTIDNPDNFIESEQLDSHGVGTCAVCPTPTPPICYCGARNYK